MLTITEALADLKTMEKRIQKKRESILMYLVRQDGIKDPHAKDGGSEEFVRRERQAIADLEDRHVAIRVAIQQANHQMALTVADQTRTIAGWLTWRKEVAPGAVSFVQKMRTGINAARTQASQKTRPVLAPGQSNTTDNPLALVVNADESDLTKLAETYETILGTLDGKLSLLNATTTIGIE